MKDSMGDRMKGNYEIPCRNYFPHRGYVLARIDGKAFHSYTRGFKPFSNTLRNAFVHVAEHLISNVSGCKLVYLQSDEITVLLTDFDTIHTDPWFNNNQDKLNSVLASMVTAVFNRFMYFHDLGPCIHGDKIAMFDCRTWFMADPFEVYNQFVWRQKDWVKNSIQMFARQYFSHKQLEGVNCVGMIKMCERDGYYWDQLPNEHKNGILISKDYGSYRRKTPVFTQLPTVLTDSIPTFFTNADGEALPLSDVQKLIKEYM